MTLFHSFTDQTTIDFVERSPDLKKLLIELNHRYNIVACCKVKDSHAVSLLWPNLMFAGVAWIEHKLDTQPNEEKKLFCIESNVIEKERGRGRDRYTRKSEKLPYLIKTIAAPFGKQHKLIIESNNLKVTGARSSVIGMMDSKIRRLSYATYLSGSEEHELLKSCLMGEPMPQHLRDKAAESLIKHTQREKENLEREKTFRKFDRVHILWGSSVTPVCYGIARLVDNEYVIHGEVKPCFDERDLPDDFAVHMKMHKISKEHTFKDNPGDGFTPMHNLLLRKDMYDEDFDTVTYYGSSEAYKGTKYIYVTPIQSDNAN